jgi:hypothetical protein
MLRYRQGRGKFLMLHPVARLILDMRMPSSICHSWRYAAVTNWGPCPQVRDVPLQPGLGTAFIQVTVHAGGAARELDPSGSL